MESVGMQKLFWSRINRNTTSIEKYTLYFGTMQS